MPRGKRTKGGQESAGKKDKRINLRVTTAQFDHLIREAGGKTTVSEHVLSKLFSGGMRNHDVLRQVATLHELGMAVKALAQNPSASKLEIRAALASVQRAIIGLAKQLP